MATKKATVKCGEALTINNVANLHDSFTKALEKSSTIELDLKSIDKVDTAGLQLLLALRQEVEKSSGKLIYKTPSESLIQVAELTGMAVHLNMQA